MTMREVTKQ